MKTGKKIVVTKNGPYLVSGSLPLIKEIAVVGEEGEPEKWVKGKKYPKQKNYALCRCGKSKNKPFCDGNHIKEGFKGEDAAPKETYLNQAEKISGPDLVLTDAPIYCAGARFCHLSGGTWNNVKNSDNPKAKKIAIQTACNCPSGRLVVWNKKTGKAIEPKLKQSISLIEDPQAKASGPIWLKGGVPLESGDGGKYQTRNRVTLCRCGRSQNKPFCDGSHLDARFNDGDESLK
ncbi:MAG: CDGSH iron-sulfur domain-containing protein [Patescibacteria group bacterium]|nr:CDGSH iron-sulfur domain-containing protein [Patescibacteria group bacterium]